MEFLEWIYFDNTVSKWLIAAGVCVGTLILVSIIRVIVQKRLSVLARKTSTDLDDLVLDLFHGIKWFLLLAIALYCGAQVLTLPLKLMHLLRNIFVIALLLQSIIWGNQLIKYCINRYSKRENISVITLSVISVICRIVLISIVVLLALDNLGFDVTTLVAGLGIGGIAIALALQNILGDLFASFTIIFDKPFEIGDFIIVGDLMGKVEHVGLKTTRVRSLSGEQLVFSNGDLLKSRIRNFKRMYERRVPFHLGVTYQTPYEKLAAIPGMIRDIIQEQQNIRFDRAHFQSYGDFSLNFEVVYL
jgi:small-conductance mechanosensitive channel